jgi:hypothetical protein
MHKTTLFAVINNEAKRDQSPTQTMCASSSSVEEEPVDASSSSSSATSNGNYKSNMSIAKQKLVRPDRDNHSSCIFIHSQRGASNPLPNSTSSQNYLSKTSFKSSNDTSTPKNRYINAALK